VPTRTAETNAWMQVSAGGHHTCASDAEQSAWCWGANWALQLGTLGSFDRLVPTRLQSQPVAIPRVFAGGAHSCALSNNGSGYCWSVANATGVLGIGEANGDTVPHAIAGGHMWASLAAGGERMCGLTTTGAPYCWGLRRQGDWAVGDSVLRAPELVMEGRLFTRVSTAGGHACALEVGNGAAWCWGRNTEGQLGSGGSSTPPGGGPVTVAGDLTFSRIAAGNYHTCGIATNGATYCWGYNEHGQVGDGTNVTRSTPTRVAGS
ncbi:MAG: RCC1 domain-containing protein, partial [Gemmatimonadaceae bacterium]